MHRTDVSSCKNCLKTFTQSRLPKLLDCLHYFCNGCLNAFAESEGGKYIECPTCQLQTPLGGYSVDDFLITNFSVELHDSDTAAMDNVVVDKNSPVEQMRLSDENEDSSVQFDDMLNDFMSSLPLGLDVAADSHTNDATSNHVGPQYLHDSPASARQNFMVKSSVIDSKIQSHELHHSQPLQRRDLENISSNETRNGPNKMEFYHHISTLQCGNCDTNASSHNEFFGCLDCEIALCAECVKLHGQVRSFISHEISNYKDFSGKLADKLQSLPSKCSLHFDKTVELCCESCHMAVCQTCFVTYHSGHKMSPLKEAVSRERECIKALQSKLKVCLRRLGKETRRIDASLLSHSAEVEKLHGDIDRETSYLIAEIVKRQQAAHFEVDALSAHAIEALRAAKERVSLESARLVGACELAASIPAAGSDLQLYTTTMSTHASLRDALRTRRDQERERDSCIEFDAGVNVIAVSSDSCSSLKGAALRLFQVSTLSPLEYLNQNPLCLPLQYGSSIVIGCGVGSGLGQLQSPIGLALSVVAVPSIRTSSSTGHKNINNDDDSIPSPSVSSSSSAARDQPLVTASRVTGGHGDASAVGGVAARLFVANGNNNRVDVFDGITGSFLRCIGKSGDSRGGRKQGHEGRGDGGSLNNPFGLCLYHPPRGSLGAALLFVADWGNDRVQVFDADSGSHIRVIGLGKGAGPGFLHSPYGVALYVPAHREARAKGVIGRADSTKSLPGTIREQARGPPRPQSASSARKKERAGDHGVDPMHGNAHVETALSLLPLLFVSDGENHRVCVFNASTGAYLRSIGSGPGCASDQLNNPTGVAIYSRNRTRPQSHSLSHSRPQSHSLSHSHSQLPMQSPSRLRSGGSRHRNDSRGSSENEEEEVEEVLLFVSDWTNHCVKVFDALSGRFLRSIGQGQGHGRPEAGGATLADLAGGSADLVPASFFSRKAGTLRHPLGLAIDRPPTDPRSHEDRQSPNRRNLSPPTFDSVEGVPMAPLLYVTEWGYSRVQVFNALTGAYIREVSPGGVNSAGDGGKSRAVDATGLASPGAVAAHASEGSHTTLYVSDTANHRVQVFTV